MILVRPFRSEDKPRCQAMYAAQGFEYQEPDWAKMSVGAMVEVDGEIQMAAFLRPTAETYLLFNPAEPVTKRERLGQLMILHKELIRPAQRAGIETVNCWVPPEVGKFGQLLLRLGWTKPLWTCYAKEVG